VEFPISHRSVFIGVLVNVCAVDVNRPAHSVVGSTPSHRASGGLRSSFQFADDPTAARDVNHLPLSMVPLEVPASIIEFHFHGSTSSGEGLPQLPAGLQLINFGTFLYESLDDFLWPPALRTLQLSSKSNQPLEGIAAAEFAHFAPSRPNLQSVTRWCASAVIIQRTHPAFGWPIQTFNR
jgi:hypothetical protein